MSDGFDLRCAEGNKIECDLSSRVAARWCPEHQRWLPAGPARDVATSSLPARSSAGSDGTRSHGRGRPWRYQLLRVVFGADGDVRSSCAVDSFEVSAAEVVAAKQPADAVPEVQRAGARRGSAVDEGFGETATTDCAAVRRTDS